MKIEEAVKIPLSGTSAEVVIPRIAVQALMLDIARKIPRPNPPVQTIKIGGVMSQERNHAHPAYITAMQEWDALVQAETTEYILREVGEANKDRIPEDELPLIARVREKYSDIISEQPDYMVWLRYVACRSNEDISAIAITARTGEPCEEGIEAYKKGFRRLA